MSTQKKIYHQSLYTERYIAKINQRSKLYDSKTSRIIILKVNVYFGLSSLVARCEVQLLVQLDKTWGEIFSDGIPELNVPSHSC